MNADNAAFLITRKCKCCGKKFTVVRPKLYAYKRSVYGRMQWFCSWPCIYAFDHGDDVPKSYPRQLRRIREMYRIDTQEMADYLGVCVETYRRYEIFDCAMPPERLVRCAHGFGCEVAHLISAEFDPDAAAKWVCVIPGKRNGCDT
jgi:hypothetical protein